MVPIYHRRNMEGFGNLALLIGLVLQYTTLEGKLVYLKHAFSLIWLLCFAIGSQVEGLRLPQILSGLFYFVWSVYYIIRTRLFLENPEMGSAADIIFSILAGLALVLNVYFTAALGPADFSKVKIDGPFKVGVTFTSTTKFKNELSVYYPVDNGDKYERGMREGRNALWIRNTEKRLCAMS